MGQFRTLRADPEVAKNPQPAADNRPAQAYLRTMAKPGDKPSRKLNAFGAIALFAPLIAILAASMWYAARAWMMADGVPMPANSYIAMTLGVFFSLAVGFGLMTLLFYSNRHGYDDISYGDPRPPENDRD